MRDIRCLDLGLAEYQKVYELQKNIVQKNKEDPIAIDQLLLVEHPNTYTFGRKSDYSTIEGENAFAIERGGEGTFHNPGQLVAYPIIKLKDSERDITTFLRNLERSIIGLMNDFNIQSEVRPGATGVWIKNKNKKIASIGISVKSWVTYHGCAINVNNELNGFSKIQPCGFSPSIMTSMKEELNIDTINFEKVKSSFKTNFEKYFKRKILQ